MDDSRKIEKETFVTAQGGSTYPSTLAVTQIAVSLYIIFSECRTPKSFFPSLLFQFAIFVLPSILATSRHYPLFLVVIHGSGFLLLLKRSIRAYLARRKNKSKKPSFSHGRIPFITIYKSLTMILTCISILSVDFPIFPREFVKTETFGVSLMDVGVGMFVFSSGVTTGKKLYTNSSNFGRVLWSAIPMLILGLSRLVSVKSVNYQEHVSEYGVHWNFFFTLFFLPIMVHLCKNPLRYVRLSMLGICLALAYQTILSLSPLEDFILYGERTNLISMNREGIFSLIGYLSIFLVAADVGDFMLKIENKTISQWHFIARKLLVGVVGCGSALFVIEMFTPISNSRRMANLPFVLWICFLNMLSLLGLLWVDLTGFFQLSIPKLLDSINSNSLLVFLIANLLTGAVNLSLDTLRTSDVAAFFILTGYMALVCGFSLLLTSWKRKPQMKPSFKKDH